MSDDKLGSGMLKSHKNGFLNVIRINNMVPSDFLAKEETLEGREAFVLKAVDTPFLFAVSRSEYNFDSYSYCHTRFKPGLGMTYWEAPPNDSIKVMYQMFSDWIRDELNSYIEEIEEPDLWAQIQPQTPVVSDGPVGSDDREPFTEPEQAQLRMAIKEFRQLVIDKIGPSEEHLSLIDNRLDYLSEQVGQLNRINWRSLAFSTLISITIALSLNNEQGKELFELFKQVFSNVVLLLQQ